MREIELGELELARLQRRLDLLDEMQVSLLGLRVVGVAGHRDIAAGGVLAAGGRGSLPHPHPPPRPPPRFSLPGAPPPAAAQRRAPGPPPPRRGPPHTYTTGAE